MGKGLRQILQKQRLESILKKIGDVKIGIIGDGCVDIYWEADMNLSELSLETPHFPLPVVKERFSLGAGSNVAANAVDLGAGSVSMVTVIGQDWRGELFTKLTGKKGIDTSGTVRSENRITPAYGKPLRINGDVVYEDPRIDFENRSPLSREDESKVVQSLRELSEYADVIAVCDQFTHSVITRSVRNELSGIHSQGTPVTADSRKRLSEFTGLIIKPNEGEASRALDREYPETDMDRMILLKELHSRTGTPLLLTMGPRGVFWYDGSEPVLIPAVPVEERPIDIVGAGDAFLSGFCCALGTGALPWEAAAVGNLAASVTVKKIGITGTAAPSEIINAYEQQ
jgi:rfaE bifunctional protein kinase chain/domain